MSTEKWTVVDLAESRHGNESPLVTAVIPTRNRPHLVCRAVRSALNQTYPSVEVVVVVDGCDPASVEALKMLGDKRLRIIELPNSVGGAEARNIGAREAAGRYIALLDDDDEWLPTKLSTQVELAKSAASEDVVVASRFIYRHLGRADEIWPQRLPESGKLSEALFDSCGGLQTSTLLCGRRLFLTVPFCKDLKGHQDYDWLLRVTARPGVQLLIAAEATSVYHIGETGGNVGSSFDWRKSLAWGRANQSLMTPLGYSRFIAYQTTRLAVLQGARRQAFIPLIREMLSGRLEFKMVALFLSKFLVSVSVRSSLRKYLRASRRGPVAFVRSK